MPPVRVTAVPMSAMASRCSMRTGGPGCRARRYGIARTENVVGGTPSEVAVSAYVPGSLPNVYVTDATPPLSVVLVPALTDPPAAVQLTTLSETGFAN